MAETVKGKSRSISCDGKFLKEFSSTGYGTKFPFNCLSQSQRSDEAFLARDPNTNLDILKFRKMAILQRSSEFVLRQPCIQDQFTMRWAYLKNRIKIPCITIITCCQFPTDFSCNSIYKINSTRLFDGNEIIGMINDMMFQIVLILV